MASNVKINTEDMQGVHADLERSRQEIDSIQPSLRDRSSKSIAMDEFEKRIEDLKQFLKQYMTLLDKDSEKLEKAVLAYLDLDETEAKKYTSSLAAIHREKDAQQAKSARSGAGGYGRGGGSR